MRPARSKPATTRCGFGSGDRARSAPWPEHSTRWRSSWKRPTPGAGRVAVAVHRAGDDLETSVTDSGEGIMPGALPHIFDRFNKGSSSSGSGLGLAIARDLVVAHGGTIEAASQTGSGTTVRFTL